MITKSRMQLLLATFEMSTTASGGVISIMPSWEAYSTDEVQLDA